MCSCPVWGIGTYQDKGASSRGNALGSVNLTSSNSPRTPKVIIPRFSILSAPHPVPSPTQPTQGTGLSSPEVDKTFCLATGHGTGMRPRDWQFGRTGCVSSCSLETVPLYPVYSLPSPSVLSSGTVSLFGRPP